MVVDKPPGLVVHPAPGHRGVTLVELLARARAGRWEPARRAPPRPRHLGADAGRQGRAGAAGAAGGAAPARGRCASTWRSSTGGSRRGRARSTRRSGRDVRRRTRMSDAHGQAARGAHPLRGRAVPRRLHARARAARDRPHPSDQGPLRRDRAPARGRPRLRRRATSSASSASSCTARAWRLPHPADGAPAGPSSALPDDLPAATSTRRLWQRRGGPSPAPVPAGSLESRRR